MTPGDFYHQWISPQVWCNRVGIRPAMQIVAGLVLLAGSILLFAQSIELIPGDHDVTMARRSTIAEMAGMQIAAGVTNSDQDALKQCLDVLIRRYPEIHSAGVRTREGLVVAQTALHDIGWADSKPDFNTPTHIHVPFFKNDAPWGQLELCFAPLDEAPGWAGWWHSRMVQFMAFMLCGIFMLYWLYLSRMLRGLDPSSTVPERVQVLLDTMVEGAVIIDNMEHIVVANQAFAAIAFSTVDRLIGKTLSSLTWLNQDGKEKPDVFPWTLVERSNLQQRGIMLRLKVGTRHTRSLSVNASPISSPDGKYRGSMVTFSDQTVVEAENQSLTQLISAG